MTPTSAFGHYGPYRVAAWRRPSGNLAVEVADGDGSIFIGEDGADWGAVAEAAVAKAMDRAQPGSRVSLATRILVAVRSLDL